MNRSQVPRGVERDLSKKYTKVSEKLMKESLKPMNFKKGKARKKRPDTGKKITKDKSYH